MNTNLKKLLLQMADDELILGHRNSEWTGLGPMMEEDIAFSSMAQDKLGHALGLFELLHKDFEEMDADTLAFRRAENELTCCHLVELPIREYDFSLVRHFMFDHAEYLRYDALSLSSFTPLATLARKYRSEIKYHIMHANTWMKHLTFANEESKTRIQSAIDEIYPMALGIFEANYDENTLQEENIFIGEKALKVIWENNIKELFSKWNLTLPFGNNQAFFGGRKGLHTEYLQPLLLEMSEVLRYDESAEDW